ncbi:hypothetical protein FisN_3Hh592 [Fistulifera solaris]|uniref:Uncharacterized protein n=1 Tax=Fistulifera solaris TaxID=1519565 RepID=A0A1Z5K3K9_FISSO|nr:hypothetical protein FisN_3Hh592 [Fistulifera solaris]|eukprot:GAX20558.1 hypothetical protein FisN_3Hh592 [Fistulifera solaris]
MTANSSPSSLHQSNNDEDLVERTHPASHDGEDHENEVETPTSSPSEEEPSQPKSFCETITSPTLRPFVIISTSYLLFTITDGAIRMIVLLHAYNKSFSALQVAYMFTLYELAGVVTNLAAGFLGAQWGIRYTLLCGLLLQLLSYGLLFGWNDTWSQQTAIVYVTIAQMFAGIAKDLTKLGGKTVTKLVTPEDKETQLFRLVSLLTGWKNSLKGVGYFLGSALLQVSYELALCVMMGLVLLALPWAYLGLDNNLGTAKKENATWRSVFKMDNTNLNWLSAARLFLFASRDFWFEVPLPFFLRSPACEGLGETVCALGEINDICQVGSVCVNEVCTALNSGGGCGGLGMNRVVVGAMLGGYIILYGQVQSWTPQWITGPLQQTPPNKWTEVWWGVINSIPTLIAGCLLQFAPAFENNGVEDAEERNEVVMTILMIVILVTFAFVFAVNSSIHSYLIVAYASMDKVAVSVGFYYMSNAVGRLFGTLGSGLLYTYVGETDWATAASGHDAVAGLAACFFAGTICSLLAAWITIRIDDNKSGLKCGPCWTIVPVNEGFDKDDEEQAIVEQQQHSVGVVVNDEVNREEDGGSKPYKDATPSQ